MCKNKAAKQAIIRYIFAFMLPFTVMLVILFLLDAYPFGEHTLVVWDANAQYVDFLVYYKKIMSGDVSWQYSFTKTFGGDIAGLFGYYLSSPFNLIALLFEDGKIPIAFQLICMVKMAAAAVAYQFFLNSSEKNCDWSSVFFSATYALSAYCFGYGFNIMWLDAVIILPVLARGIHRLLKSNKVGLYAVALGYGLVTCYYTGYILCVFSVMYFGVHWLLDEKKTIGTLIRFGVSSICTAGVLAIWLIPMAMSLMGGKADLALTGSIWSLNYSLIEMFEFGLTGSFTTYDMFTPGDVPLFCGVAIAFMAIASFVSPLVDKKKKIIYGSMLGFVLFSTALRGLNIAWQGFAEPSGCAYRYSFIFSFLVIICAREFWNTLSAEEDKKTAVIAAVIWCCCIIVATLGPECNKRYALFDFAIVMVLLILLTVSSKVKRKWIPLTLILFLHVIDIGQSGKVTWNLLLNDAGFERDYYESYVEQIQPIVNEIDQLDEDLYRMELDYSVRRSYNDAMVFSYAGLSHYSSSEKMFLEEFQKNVGMPGWAIVDAELTFPYDLTGLRYIVSNDVVFRGLDRVLEYGDFYVYENEKALPMIFASEDVVMWDSILDREYTGQWPEYIKCENTFRKSDDYISTEVTLQESGKVYTTIPYESGWTVTVDGKRIEMQKWMETFLCFEIEEGRHLLVFSYQLPGLTMGLVITACFSIFSIAWFVMEKKYGWFRYAKQMYKK